MRRLLAFAPLALLAALVLVFAVFSLRRNPQVTPTATVGKPAPDVTLPALADGKPTRLRAALKGPVLVNFFASWCAPCVDEAPALDALKAEGVRIVGVAYKDDPEKTSLFLSRYGDPFETVVTDRDARAGVEFGTTGVPETYAIDAAGMIRAKHAGPITAAEAEDLLKAAQR